MINKNSCFLHAGDYSHHVDKKHHMCYTEKKHYISNLRNSNHISKPNQIPFRKSQCFSKTKISREIADLSRERFYFLLQKTAEVNEFLL